MRRLCHQLMPGYILLRGPLDHAALARLARIASRTCANTYYGRITYLHAWYPDTSTKFSTRVRYTAVIRSTTAVVERDFD